MGVGFLARPTTLLKCSNVGLESVHIASYHNNLVLIGKKRPCFEGLTFKNRGSVPTAGFHRTPRWFSPDRSNDRETLEVKVLK